MIKRIAAFSAALLLAVCSAGLAQSRSDILWNIVNNCLAADAASRAAACPAQPRPARPLASFQDAAEARRDCRASTEIWDQAPGAFVAFRDIKQCDCLGRQDFVHGLALPFAEVTGVEDPQRPDGLWAFAWSVALQKIGDKQMIGLVVNPESGRTQNQLHVHLVRLRPDYLKRIAANPGAVLRTVPLRDLSRVWPATLPAAGAGGFRDFGVLVTSDGADGYLLRVIDPGTSPEGEYTQWSCKN
ncbi:MAG: hypothetical protein JWN73_2636 [Betaproteobacteria bacterium]|nr:hypothetical protein [Betaproteobacteria bacterium]